VEDNLLEVIWLVTFNHLHHSKQAIANMASSRSLRSNNIKLPIQPQPPIDVLPIQPTYSDITEMLVAAQQDAISRYKHLPQLRNELQEQYHAGILACNTRERNPRILLLARLRGERLVFDAYNKHRLGKAAQRYFKPGFLPTDAHESSEDFGEDIEEDLE
jgi:hypothetical protein